MSKAETTEHTTDCQPLLELATPHIYRCNLFRVLGLPVNATAKEVQRQQAKRKMAEKLGVASTQSAQGPLSLEPTPTELETRAAMERLNRPIDRMLDEVFWFWALHHSGEDAALKLLEAGDAGSARKLWREDADNIHATHNLAVLDHMAALDLEVRGLTTPLTEREQERLATLWKAVFPRWKQVFESEELSATLKARVREINDEQLSTGFARRICNSLPFALLLINAKLACAAAERGDRANAQRQLALLEAAKFEDGLAKQVLKAALQRIRERIKTNADNARSRWKKAGQRGAQFVRELAEQGGKLLDIVDILLPESDPARAAMHDIIIEAMMEGQIAYGRKTDDWNGSIKLLELALTLHPGEAVKARLFETIEVLKKNAESGGDWVSEGYWDLPEEAIEQLEAVREKSRAFDHDGALTLLSNMDMRLGAPLKRCVAFTLRGKGIQIFNKGIGIYNEQTPHRQALWDKLVGMSEDERIYALMRTPDPNVSAYMNPKCISCGSGYYTSWYNFTIRNVPLWWCADCQRQNLSQWEDQKLAFRPEITHALEYMLLADETSPEKDAAITDDIVHFKKMAFELAAPISDTKGLRKRLSTSSMRGTLLVLDASPLDCGCAFCDGPSSDPAAAITVPMCGDVQSVEMMFGTGIEYRHTDVIVPRCRGCCTEHREFPARLELWNQARDTAMRDEHFPLQAATAQAAAQAAKRAAQDLAALQRAKAVLDQELARATDTGSECPGCKSAKGWKDGVCETCDKATVDFGALARIGLGLFGTFFVISVLLFIGMLVFAEKFQWFTIPGMIVHGTIAWLIYNTRTKRRIKLSAKRLPELATQRTKAIHDVETKLEASTLALGSAFTTSKNADARKEETEEALRTSKAKAAKDFERTFQKPTLNNGTRDEATFIESEPIQRFRTRGWAFGSTLDAQTHVGAAEPLDVKGIVGPKPKAPIEKAALAPVKRIRSMTPPALKSL